MERLTFDGLFCDIVKCDSTPGGTFCESGTCTLRKVWERLKEYEDAEQDGRLVVLDEPRKPLVWGDDNRDTILCPNCKHDLMGGFQEADSCETPMYQCPYCGQPIDGKKALTREEAEAALEKKVGVGNGT